MLVQEPSIISNKDLETDMPIERLLKPDFQSEDLCDWLSGNQPTFVDDLNILEEIGDGTDYEASKLAGIILPTDKTELVLFTFTETIYRIKYRNTDRDFADLKGVSGTGNRVLVGAIATLFLKKGISPDKAGRISSAFQSFAANAQTLGTDASRVEKELAEQAVETDDYYVKLVLRLERLEKVKEFDNNDELLQSIDNTEGTYQVISSRETTCCRYPDYVLPDDKTTEVDDVDDKKQVDDAIQQTANDKAAESDCNGIITRHKRIGTLYQRREWKTEWEMQWIRVGKCRLIKTRVPVVYHRTRKRALYAYTATTANADQFIGKAMEDCAWSAAISTGLIVLIVGGMDYRLAVAAWSSAFLQCMKDKIDDGVRCVIHDCEIVTEKGEWEVGL
jgi:hypothetical protein